MTQSATKTKPLVMSAVFAALGSCVQIIEGYIPSAFPLPGGKLGLSNVVNMVVLRCFGVKHALLTTAMKSIVAMLLSGNVSALPYSLAGGIFSVIFMYIVEKMPKRPGSAGIGIIGAWTNNIAQTAVGALIMSNIHILSYIWILGPVSVVTGAFTGIVSDFIVRKFNVKNHVN